MKTKEREIRVGGVVRLKSGGPDMRVIGISNAATVTWQNAEGESQFETFPLHCISPASADQ